MKRGTIFFNYAWDEYPKNDCNLLSFLKDCIKKDDIDATLR